MGSLLFNVFINDLFFLVEETEICNYADDTTIYVCGHKLEHIVSSLETAGQKLHALARISNYVDVEKLRVMMNAFIISQFSYCPLVWMFHDRSSRLIRK